MDDYGSDTKWLWVLGIVVLVVAVVGLVIAISAKNNGVDEDKVTSQISEELEAAGVAAQGDKEASDRAESLAAADRRRIKRAVRSERAEAERRIDGLAADNKELTVKNAEMAKDVTRLQDDTAALRKEQEATASELEALERRVEHRGG